MLSSLLLKGVKQNNLKNLDISIPHGSFTVITGPSGSGKSSLAFDTIFKEGQRLYIESLSTYVRQFLERIERPQVDVIENICPTIAVEQKNNIKNSRSTVASSTEIFDYLKLFFSKIGKIYCPHCSTPIQKDTVSNITNFVLNKLLNQKIYILAPFKITQKTSKNLISDLIRRGLTRAVDPKQPEKIVDLTQFSFQTSHREICILLDRLTVTPGNIGPLTDSLEIAYQESHGRAYILDPHQKLYKFSLELSCSQCDYKFPETSPAFFSFNHPYGACATCKGFGNILKVDEELVVLNPMLSLREGAIDPWTKPSHRQWQERLLPFAKEEQIPITVPYKQLSIDAKKKIFEGSKSFKGVLGFFKRLETKKYKMGVRVFLSRYKSPFECPQCKGTRLRPETECVKIQQKSISDIHALTIGQAHDFFSKISLTPFEAEVSKEILKQLKDRIDYLKKVGLDYISLHRLTRTLSGGEAQRMTLATQLGARLIQTLYILDEPTIGLHARDSQKLLDILFQLKNLGNTMIVVEHDLAVMRKADYIIELGPQGGQKGGYLVYQGPLSEFYKRETLTSAYLQKKMMIEQPSQRRIEETPILKLTGISHHNLKSIDLMLPLNKLVCITGVSGSGKSSLVHETLYYALARIFNIEFRKIGRFKTISGFKQLQSVSLLDQQPIGKSSRSNPITYMKGYDDIRKLFSETRESRIRGYTPSTFSFNTVGGRCDACEGEGIERIEMHFLADIALTCETCRGLKFKKEVLEIKFKNKNIHDVLSMTIDETSLFFSPYPHLQKKLSLLKEVGLGYLTLGQSATTLSGGEAQRLKIAKELSHGTEQTLYILDEPTTGLHLDDIQKLLRVLNRLIDQGNSVVIIEHNLDVIKTADWIIDLGPEAGERGGEIIAEGTPEEIIKNPRSYTGQYLKQHRLLENY